MSRKRCKRAKTQEIIGTLTFMDSDRDSSSNEAEEATQIGSVQKWTCIGCTKGQVAAKNVVQCSIIMKHAFHAKYLQKEKCKDAELLQLKKTIQGIVRKLLLQQIEHEEDVDTPEQDTTVDSANQRRCTVCT